MLLLLLLLGWCFFSPTSVATARFPQAELDLPSFFSVALKLFCTEMSLDKFSTVGLFLCLFVFFIQGSCCFSLFGTKSLLIFDNTVKFFWGQQSTFTLPVFLCVLFLNVESL